MVAIEKAQWILLFDGVEAATASWGLERGWNRADYPRSRYLSFYGHWRPCMNYRMRINIHLPILDMC